MDVLVQWKDGTKNIVRYNELKSASRNQKIEVGSRVKMFYINKWYKGVVLDMETEKILNSDDSEDNLPLAEVAKLLKKTCTDSDDSDDRPLQQLKRKKVESAQGTEGKLHKIYNIWIRKITT